MDITTDMIIEGVGYLGSLIILISMLTDSLKKLRIINSVGSIIFVTYAVIIHSYPTAALNFALVIINIVELVRLKKEEHNYKAYDCYKDESLIQIFLKSNLDDIKAFFPTFDPKEDHTLAFLVCSGSMPVGILIGRMSQDMRLNIELDYTIPAYRDCSVGEFLYKYLEDNWFVKEMVFAKKSVNHERYLTSMGFRYDDGKYVRRCRK